MDTETLLFELEKARKDLAETEAQLEDDPTNVPLNDMKDAYKTLIEQYEDILKDNEGEQQKELSLASDDAKSPTEPHGVLQASRPTRGAVPADNANPAIVFEVNDMVLAKWQGDRSYYPARIINRTGPRTNFQYQVKFKTYDNTEMVKASDIKPMASNQHNKRKAEEISANATPPVLPTPQNSNIISAAASVDPKLANQARKEPNQTSDGALKPAKIARKVKANKELEAGKSKWQNFTKGKTGKAGKKESMFRTPDGINARVGFTGSGQAMRKDPSRNRHLYQPEED